MSKYLVIWGGDASKWPTDPRERFALSTKFNEMTKQDMKEGKIVDWGIFVEGNRGYSVVKGNGSDLYKNIQRYRPYMTFEVHQVLSLDEHLEALKAENRSWFNLIVLSRSNEPLKNVLEGALELGRVTP